MFLKPDWPLPDNVKALYTTRQGGVSLPPFDSFNLATHVEDLPSSVRQNRQLLVSQNQLPSEPVWLNQQHTDTVVELAAHHSFNEPPIADASWTQQPHVVSLVMTADCLPILIADKQGSCVAAIHAGWKGLAKGIVSKTIKTLPAKPHSLMAWIGPAISAKYFEVGQDVFDAFVQKNANYNQFFQTLTVQPKKYLADLPGLVSLELKDLGVEQVYNSGLCSYENTEQFYSYRREAQTGRMAALIWIDNPHS